MICPTCQAEVADDSAFCNKCGQPIQAAEANAAEGEGEAPAAAFTRTTQTSAQEAAQPEQPLRQGRCSRKQFYPI